MDKIMMGYMHKNNDTNSSPTIIKPASILPPDEYALMQGINECCNPNIGIADCTSYLPDDIVNNLPDDVIIAPNLTTPEELHYPREEYRTQVGELYCLICGKPFPWYCGESHRIIICDACKRAIAWAKEKMKEKE